MNKPIFPSFADIMWNMGLALEEADQAYLKGEVPVGAVLVKDGEVVAVLEVTSRLRLSAASSNIPRDTTFEQRTWPVFSISWIPRALAPTPPFSSSVLDPSIPCPSRI